MTNQSLAIERGYSTRQAAKSLEEELVQKACSGNREAFGELYDRFVDRIYRYIYFRITDEPTAEDLTSRVFLKAWENLPRYRATATPFMAWLYTIAHNAVIDHYRMKHPTTGLDDMVQLSSNEPRPDEQCESVFEGQALRRSLMRLTQAQRDVIVMKIVQGMETNEIAVLLGKTEGAVRALQMRALQTLAKIYREEEGRIVDMAEA